MQGVSILCFPQRLEESRALLQAAKLLRLVQRQLLTSWLPFPHDRNPIHGPQLHDVLPGQPGASQGSTRAELMMPTMCRSPRRCHPSSENPTSFWNGSLSACRRLAGNRASAAGATGADACRMASGHVPSSTTPAPGQEEETRRPRSHSESTSHRGRRGWWCRRLFFWAPPLRPRSAAASSKRPSSVEPRRRRGQGGDKTRDIAGVLPSPRPAADAPNGTHPRG